MNKSVALIDIRLWLYMHYHRKESLLNVFESIYSAVPIQKFSKIYFIYDSGKSKYHKEIYKDYKENRTILRAKQTPAEKKRYAMFTKEYNAFPEITKYFGTNVKIDGTEADTMIEVLAQKYADSGWDTYILSSDGDFNILLDIPNIYQITAKGEFLDAEAVIKKKGVTPEQLLWSKCLSGDQKDNIKGLRNLGEVKDNKTGKVIKSIMKNKSLNEVIFILQSMVNKGTRGVSIPENYGDCTTVEELYLFNLELNKPFTFSCLSEEDKCILKEQMVVKTTPFNEDEFNMLCFNTFGKGIVLQDYILKFFTKGV